MIKKKALQRPDKQLEKMLLGLVFAIISTALSILMLFIFPQNSLLFLSLTLFLTMMSIGLAIIVISESEKALTYGGLANVILAGKEKISRVDNAFFDAVIENDLAKKFFENHKVMTFLKNQALDDKKNQLSLVRVENALKNLKEEKVTLELTKGGENRFYQISLRPLYLKKNDIFESDFSIEKIKKETYFLWQIEDVTAAQNIEKILDEERQRLSRFIKDMPLGLYILDDNQKIEYVNNAAASVFGDENIIGRALSDFIKKEDYDLLFLSPHNANFVHLKNKKGDTSRVYIVQTTYFENECAKVRGLMLLDLPTDQKLLEEIDQSRKNYQQIFDDNPIGVVFVSSKGKITARNAKAEEILSLNAQEACLADCFEKADLKRLEQIYDVYLQDENKNDKTTFETLLLSEKTALITVLPFRKLKGKKMALSGLLIYVEDTTKNKNLEEQFVQAQKMQAMGQFAGGIAHDFNNLLTAMIGFCDLLLQRHRIGDPSFADLNEIKQNAVRAAGLVRQLLAFSRRQPSNPKLIDLAESFADLNQFLKRILGEQITLEFYHDANLGFIRMDPVQFTQVIMNLAVNAKDAMNGKGVLKISTRLETLIEPYTYGAETIKPGDFVVISVSDTGCGIKKENLSRIFDPFFSTKQNVVGSGTGLGLATVYGIVTQTNGFLKVESELNKGTTFKIYLPRFENDGKQAASLSNDLPAAIPVLTSISKEAPKLIFGLNVTKLDHGNEEIQNTGDIKILFVEDEASVRAFGVRALKKKGFQVTACSSGENALEQDGKFDLMITDMVMPGISGAELSKLIRQKMPDIKIILASGYSEEIAKKELAGCSDFTFIAKPYSLGDLVKKVYEVLNG